MAPRFGGPKKTGPDLSWADEDLPDPTTDSTNHRATSPPSNIPAPTFPPRHNIRTPKPLSHSEKQSVASQLQFHRTCHSGPLYTVLNRDSLLVEGEAHVKRADRERKGFDPFAGQERWSTRKLGPRRKEPDLSTRGRGEYGFSLGMFPMELWGCLDPEMRSPEWQGLAEDAVAWTGLPVAKRPGATVKRRRKALAAGRERLDFRSTGLQGHDEDDDGKQRDEEGIGSDDDDDDEDPIRGAGQRKRARMEARRAGGRRAGEASKNAVGEKQGLEAEDDYERDVVVNPEDEEEEAGEDEPVDSDFSEDEDAMNDYNAENYFDDGEDDVGDDGDGGGDDY